MSTIPADKLSGGSSLSSIAPSSMPTPEAASMRLKPSTEKKATEGGESKRALLRRASSTMRNFPDFFITKKAAMRSRGLSVQSSKSRWCKSSTNRS